MRIAIIGGGPSGMLLSILVKKQRPDYQVDLYERNPRVGKKLLATGNGRCNYTNLTIEKDNYHSENKNFPMEVINSFDNEDAISLLKTLGIYPTSEKGGKVYPLSLQGSSVLDFLRLGMDRQGVNVILNEKIDQVEKRDDQFILYGTKKYQADILVVATGGMAMPVSGSDGLGYRFAKTFGHNIIDQSPTIVQLESDFKRIKELKGVRVDTEATVLIDGRPVMTKSGDVLFTDYGLSGPAILDLSRLSIQSLKENKKVEISVNIIGIPEEEIYQMISERSKHLDGVEINKFLNGIINKKLIQSVLFMIQSKYHLKIERVEYTENFINIFTDILSKFKLNISGYKGFGQAQATVGGVDTKEIDSTSLESKLCPGLYFIGEVLDVDGDCGGYNLQWAWSTAYIAAKDISKK